MSALTITTTLSATPTRSARLASPREAGLAPTLTPTGCPNCGDWFSHCECGACPNGGLHTTSCRNARDTSGLRRWAVVLARWAVDPAFLSVHELREHTAGVTR